MLKILSYLNIILAFLYFIIYLQNGSHYLVSGIILVLVFNWQTLRRLEANNYKWKDLQYITGIISLIVSVYLLISASNLISSSLENKYYNFDLVVLEAFSLVFAVSILWHILSSFLKNLKAENSL
jgi:hypothetical protein